MEFQAINYIECVKLHYVTARVGSINFFLIFEFKFIDFEKTKFKFIDYAKVEFKFINNS